jgi:hypothetical protein
LTRARPVRCDPIVRIAFVRITVALVVLAACGGRYGETDDHEITNDAGVAFDAAVDSSPPSTPPSDAAIDVTGDVTNEMPPLDSGGTVSNDDAGVAVLGPDDVGSACLRLPNAMTRVDNTHVITLYGGTGSPAQATVTVNLADVTLVLMSYDPLTWKISVGAGGSVAKVYVHAFGKTNLDGTTVTGLAPAVPVTKRAVNATALGYTRTANVGGGDFPGTIAEARKDIGGLETTYQGSGSVAAFKVGGNIGSTGIEAYDTRVQCKNPCLRSGTVTAWTDVFGSATISGLKATLSGSFSALRTANGPRCGKHYFEITGPAGTAGMTSAGDSDFLFITSSSAPVPVGTTGVAVDLDAKSVTYYSGPTPTTHPLNLWYREALGPAWDTDQTKSGTVTLTTTGPFKNQVPTGYATDL